MFSLYDKSIDLKESEFEILRIKAPQNFKERSGENRCWSSFLVSIKTVENALKGY